MPSPYQEFVRKARERFEKNQKRQPRVSGGIEFTRHAEYKMRQYSLSAQKVKNIIRQPKRTQKGIAPRTVAVMQPVSPKTVDGKETWKQELWTMYVKKKGVLGESLRVISAWRYPGISPKGNPIPEEILQELSEEDIL